MRPSRRNAQSQRGFAVLRAFAQRQLARRASVEALLAELPAPPRQAAPPVAEAGVVGADGAALVADIGEVVSGDEEMADEVEPVALGGEAAQPHVAAPLPPLIYGMAGIQETPQERQRAAAYLNVVASAMALSWDQLAVHLEAVAALSGQQDLPVRRLQLMRYFLRFHEHSLQPRTLYYCSRCGLKWPHQAEDNGGDDDDSDNDDRVPRDVAAGNPRQFCTRCRHPTASRVPAILFPLAPQVAYFLVRPDFAERRRRIRAYVRGRAAGADRADVYDGEAYRGFVHEYDDFVSLILNHDEVQASDTGQSYAVIFAAVAELPPESRYLPHNLCLLGVFLGRDSPVWPMVFQEISQDIATLRDGGMAYQVAGDNRVHVARTVLLTTVFDLIARAQAFCAKSGGYGSCLCCKIVGVYDRSVYFPPEEPPPPPRTWEEAKEESRQAFVAAQAAAGQDEPPRRAVRRHRLGQRPAPAGPAALDDSEDDLEDEAPEEEAALPLYTYSPILEIANPLATTIDLMHLAYNICRTMLRIWVRFPELRHPDGPQSAKEWCAAVDRRMANLCPPYALGEDRMPSSLFAGAPRSDAYRQFLLYYSPMVLDELLTQPVMEHWMLLVGALRLLFVRRDPISLEELDTAERRIYRWWNNAEQIYPTLQIFTLSNHGLLHLVQCYRLVGAPWSVTCFPFESANGFLVKFLYGNRAGVFSVADRFMIWQWQARSRHPFDRCIAAPPPPRLPRPYLLGTRLPAAGTLPPLIHAALNALPLRQQVAPEPPHNLFLFQYCHTAAARFHSIQYKHGQRDVRANSWLVLWEAPGADHFDLRHWRPRHHVAIIVCFAGPSSREQPSHALIARVGTRLPHGRHFANAYYLMCQRFSALDDLANLPLAVVPVSELLPLATFTPSDRHPSQFAEFYAKRRSWVTAVARAGDLPRSPVG